MPVPQNPRNLPWIMLVMLSLIMLGITLTQLTTTTIILTALRYATALLFFCAAVLFLLCHSEAQREFQRARGDAPNRRAFVVAASICLVLGFLGFSKLPSPQYGPTFPGPKEALKVKPSPEPQVPGLRETQNAAPPAAQPAPQPAPAAPREDKPSNWVYREDTDPMRGTATRFAMTASINTLSFDFPYQGGIAHLTIRKQAADGIRIMLTIDGQFLCQQFRGDTVAVKFDDGTIEHYRCAMPKDGTTNVLFIRGENRFIAKLQRAKVLAIEAEFFQEGRRVLFFDVSGYEGVERRSNPNFDDTDARAR